MDVHRFHHTHRHEAPLHCHPHDQLFWLEHGSAVLRCVGKDWIVPPASLGWMPAETLHGISTYGPVSGVSLMLPHSRREGMPRHPTLLQASPLLKELLRKIGEYRTGDARSGRLVAVLQDELSAVSPSPLAMPWPADPRLCRIAETLLVDPADARGLYQWSTAAGMSRRTFCRRFRAETGLSFIEWRQQARLARAVELLRAGESVTATAMAVGYESVSAFVALFRARLGSPPRNFVRNREYE